MIECPKCGSNRVRIDYPEIICLACSWSEPLIDYPISYREHRAYCRSFNQPDPIPMQSPKTTDDRVSKLQSTVNTLMGKEVYRQNIQRKQQKPTLQRIDV